MAGVMTQVVGAFKLSLSDISAHVNQGLTNTLRKKIASRLTFWDSVTKTIESNCFTHFGTFFGNATRRSIFSLKVDSKQYVEEQT